MYEFNVQTKINFTGKLVYTMNEMNKKNNQIILS